MKFFLIIGLVALAAHAANAVCAPGSVQNVTFYANNTLTWTEPTNPQNCTIDYYIVNAINNADGTEYQYRVLSTIHSYYLKDLDVCQTYTLEVHALTNEAVLGPSVQHFTIYTSPPEDINLTLGIVNATSTSAAAGIFLAWNLTHPEIQRCVAYYRVSYWDEKGEPTGEYVTAQNFTLNQDLHTCSLYYFEVNAIVTTLRAIEGPISEVYVKSAGKAPSPPSIVSLNTTNTTANMVWKLESYDENQCSLVKLDVYTPSAPINFRSVSVPLNVTSEVRDDVNVIVTGLVHNTVYTSLVSVTNEFGSSENVTVTYQTAV